MPETRVGTGIKVLIVALYDFRGVGNGHNLVPKVNFHVRSIARVTHRYVSKKFMILVIGTSDTAGIWARITVRSLSIAPRSLLAHFPFPFGHARVI